MGRKLLAEGRRYSNYRLIGKKTCVEFGVWSGVCVLDLVERPGGITYGEYEDIDFLLE